MSKYIQHLMEIEEERNQSLSSDFQNQKSRNSQEDLMGDSFDNNPNELFRYLNYLNIQIQPESENFLKYNSITSSESVQVQNVSGAYSELDISSYLSFDDKIFQSNEINQSDQISEPVSIKSLPEYNCFEFHPDSNSSKMHSQSNDSKLNRRTINKRQINNHLNEVKWNDMYDPSEQESESKQRRFFNARDRRSKAQQSKAQKCIFAMTGGDYYLKNFESFYVNKLKTNHNHSKKETLEKFYRLSQQKKLKKLQKIANQIPLYRMKSKKLRNGILFKSFTETQKLVIQAFFQELIRQIYQIALQTIIRRVQNNKESQSQSRLRSLDQTGENELQTIFDKVLERSTFCESLSKVQFEERLWKMFQRKIKHNTMLYNLTFQAN